MTVKELKDLLANVPDHFEIWAYSEESAANFHAINATVSPTDQSVYIEGY